MSDERDYSWDGLKEWASSLQENLKEISSIHDDAESFLAACESILVSSQTSSETQSKLEGLQKMKRQRKPYKQADINELKEELVNLKTQLQEGLDQCKEEAQAFFDSNDFLQELSDPDFDDSELMTFVIMRQATAKGLAMWFESGETEAEYVVNLLNDSDLQRTFLQAGGANGGQYIRAMQIRDEIQISEEDPVLERLALAVALELAEPLLLFKSKSEYVDPIKRYEHYEQAYLAGELDPMFSQFTVWELRNAINSNAPDDELTWGRESLRNYRPDIVISDNPQWRYCQIVRTDVAYKTPDWYTSPHSHDQILSGGGKCGPRAWYGRFSCKTFGIPTWGCRQPGHAAMTRWTSQGWMTCLGGGFHKSYWEGQGGLDFLLDTEARNVLCDDTRFMQLVMRLEWLAVVHEEDDKSVRSSALPDKDALWSALGLMKKKIIAAAAESNEYQPQFEQSSNYNKIQEMIDNEEECDNAPFKNDDGEVIIPAGGVDLVVSKKSSINKSFLGGRQLLLMHDATFQFSVSPDHLSEGISVYEMTIYLNTAHRNEDPLILTIRPEGEPSDSDVEAEVEIPYTMCMWEQTGPVPVELDPSSENDIVFSLHRKRTKFGIAIKEIKLTPIE